MLEFIRKYLGSVVVKVILSLVALTFVLFFGISDVINRLAGKDYVIRVGDVKIGPQEFRLQYNKAADLMRRSLGNPDTYEKIRPHMLEYFVAQTVDRLMVERIIDIWGLGIDEKTVKLGLQTSAEFQDGNGQFSAEKLRAALIERQIPENVFLEDFSLNLAKSLVFMPLSLTFFEPTSVMSRLKDVILEQRSVDIVHVYNSAVPGHLLPKPTESDLRSCYQENQDIFAAEESKDITVLIMNEAKVLEQVEVSDDEVLDEYQARKEEEGENWNVTLEKIKKDLVTELKHRKLPDEVKILAAKIEDELSATKDYDGTAARYGLRILRIKNLTVSNTDAFTGKISIPLPYGREVAEIAFNTTDTNTFQETVHGVEFLVNVDKTTPSSVPEYSKIKEKVLAHWTRGAKAKAAKQIAEGFVDRVSQGMPLDKLAHSKHLTVDKIYSLTRSGTDGTSSKQNRLPADLVHKVFEAPVGQAVIIPIEGGHVVAHVKNKHLPNLDKKQAQQFRALIHSAMTRDLFAQLVKHYQKKTKVDVNQGMLKLYSTASDADTD
ncbi:MAG: peptidylprolyl isomerase [Holosporales bacterium]|jgi:peptidyl-prolyl cis-trans isomerase D|nr:peptidylprolyl isomerase [Holosporales bacterium]